MRKMRACLVQADKCYYPRQKQWWFLEAATQYVHAVRALHASLHDGTLQSRGLTDFRAWLADYLETVRFTALVRTRDESAAALAAVRYCVRIDGNAVTALNYDGESDYSSYVLEVFQRFRQGEARDHHVELKEWPEMNHVEAKVLDCVAELNSAPFALLADFCTAQVDFLDPTVLSPRTSHRRRSGRAAGALHGAKNRVQRRLLTRQFPHDS